MSSSSSTTSAPIRATVDLHCHILPNWDDGPKSLEVVLAMVERARESGIETIVATPHVGRAFKGVEHPAASIPGGVEKLQAELDSRDISIKILPGAEVMLGSVDLLGDQGVSPHWTVANLGKYALVESPYRSWPDFGNNLLYNLMLRGVRPIIAHPERYVDVQKDFTKMQTPVAQGALLQITAGSFLGQNGKEWQACAHKLLDAGWVHIVASDAHDADHVWPGEVIEHVQKRVGTGYARQIFEANPNAVLAGKPIPNPIAPTKPEASGSLLGRLLRGKR